MTYQFTPEQEAWLRDLETTEEPQCKSLLHRLPDPQRGVLAGFCCLGRACVVLGIEGEPSRLRMAYGGEATVLPEDAIKKLRLLDNIGSLYTTIDDEGAAISALTEMNDAGWSFKAIATYIREHPEDAFLPPEEDK